MCTHFRVLCITNLEGVCTSYKPIFHIVSNLKSQLFKEMGICPETGPNPSSWSRGHLGTPEVT